MKTPADLELAFDKFLRKELESIEKKRRDLLGRYSFRRYRMILSALGILCLVGVVLAWRYPETPLRWGTSLISIAAAFAILYPIFLAVIRHLKTRDTDMQLRSEVIRVVVPAIDPSLRYHADQGISQRDFDDSLLFTKTPIERYRSRGLVTGSTGGVAFQFADTVAEWNPDDGYLIAFSGIFFQADLKRQFQANILVVPDRKNSSSENSIPGFEKQVTPPLRKTEHAEFEKAFSVYSRDPDEARSVLTPPTIEAILSLQKITTNKIQLSFTNHHLNVAISTPELSLTNMQVSLNDFKTIRPLVTNLMLAGSLVDLLKLRPTS